MYSRAGQGFVLVETSATHKVGTGRKGIDGLEIIVDIIFDPIKFVINFANCLQTPVCLNHTPLVYRPTGASAYGSPPYGAIRRPANLEEPPSSDLYAIHGMFTFKYQDDIAQEVEIGDRLYFKPRTLNSPANLMGTLRNPTTKQPEKYIYKVPYENIFCAIKKDGTIKCIGGWVLCSPIMEDWQDIYKKTYYDYTDKAGNKIERPKKEWIQLKASPNVDNMRAVVAHIGTPLKGEPCDIEVGMTVVFRKMKQVFLHNIEGQDYIVMQQDQILVQLTQNVKVA